MSLAGSLPGDAEEGGGHLAPEIDHFEFLLKIFFVLHDSCFIWHYFVHTCKKGDLVV